MIPTLDIAEPELLDQIEKLLDADIERPWCVHRLFDEILASADPSQRDGRLRVTELAADRLAELGRARREFVSAISIGVHCQDSLYWSIRSERTRLEEFGPEYETPTILRRLGSHFRCHGL